MEGECFKPTIKLFHSLHCCKICRMGSDSLCVSFLPEIMVESDSSIHSRVISNICIRQLHTTSSLSGDSSCNSSAVFSIFSITEAYLLIIFLSLELHNSTTFTYLFIESRSRAAFFYNLVSSRVRRRGCSPLIMLQNLSSHCLRLTFSYSQMSSVAYVHLLIPCWKTLAIYRQMLYLVTNSTSSSST